jgi:hypothetical protein
MSLSAKDLLAKTSPPERVKRICLNGNLRGERDALREELDELSQDTVPKMGGDPRALELAQRITAIEAEMASEAVTFRFRAVSRWRLKEIQKQFPTEEKYAEWDVEAGATTLISECLVDPKLSVDELQAIFDRGNSRLPDELFSAAWLVCNQENDLPKSARASAMTRGTGSN